jgi:RNA polymerase sigma-70 factor (ECF subfamily)
MDVDLEALAVVCAQRGNEQAWKNLFEWHFEPVYRYCLAVAGGRQDVAEEITQQVFVTAGRRVNRFRPRRGTFRAWLLGIARNRFMKFQSREVRRKRHETRFFERSREKGSEESTRLLVYEALAQLPGHYRLVLEAKYLEGQTVNEIARAQGRTAKATESLLTRARERFGQVYKRLREQ